MIAIVAAMKDEVRRLRSLDRHTKGKVGVTVTGVGKNKAVAATELLFSGSPRPSFVLSLGFSGALSDDLNAGDLVLARHLHLLDGASSLDVDNRYYQLAEEAIHENVLPYVRRDTLTVPKLVRTRTERERLAQAYNAQAVSMEDYWICNAAARAGVPFLSVKAVLDTTNQELPPYVEEIMWQRERRQGMKIIFGSMAHPLRIPTLLSLGHAARKAQRSLDIFARAFVGKALERGVLSIS